MCHLLLLYCLSVDRKDRLKCLFDVQETLETPSSYPRLTLDLRDF